MSIDELYPNLRNQNPEIRERTIQQIVAERDENTISQLVATLDSQDAAYRQTVVKTLGVIGVDAIPTLSQQVEHHPNEMVRTSCVNILMTIAHQYEAENLPQAALIGLQKALQDPHPVVQLTTVSALGTIGSPAFDIFVEALETDNLALHIAIIGAIGSLGDSRGLQVLSDLSQDEVADPYIRQSATSALSLLEQVIKFNS